MPETTAAPDHGLLPGQTADAASFKELVGRAVWVLMRHRWAVLATMVIAAAVGASVVAVQPRLYSASVRVVIHPRAPTVLDKVKEVYDEGSAHQPALLDKFYNTQQDILTGRAVAELVVSRLALDRDPTFLPTSSEEGDASADDPRRTQRAVSVLRKATRLKPGLRSQVYELTVTDRDPQRAADLANAIAEAYREFSISLRQDLTSQTSQWLDGQVRGQREALERSEQAIQDFSERNGIESLTLSQWSNRAIARLGDLDRARATAELRAAEADVRKTSLEEWVGKGHRPETHPALADDADLRAIAEELNALERTLARKAERYLEKYPGQQADRDELALVRKRYDARVVELVEGVRIAEADARRELEYLNKRIEDERAEAQRLGSNEVEYNRLRREADTNAELYESVLRRAKEIQLSRNLESSNVNILERALAPTRPSHPRMLLSAFAVLLAAFVGGVLAAVVLETLDNTIKDPSEIEAFYRSGPIGVLPGLLTDGERELIALTQPRSPAAECLRAVRTNLLFIGSRRPVRRILVTSASPRDGKTTICSNLAATMALAGNRVLIIDTDMRRPQQHKVFGLNNEVGIVDVLVGAASVDEVIRPTDVPGLDVIPCGSPPRNPSELLVGKAIDGAMEHLQQRYDYIFLDSPPTLLVTDAPILSQKVDGTLVVLRIQKTERRNFRDAWRSLASVHADVLGVVCNGVDLSARRYGYGRTYGYGYGYGYGDGADGEPGSQTGSVPTKATG